MTFDSFPFRPPIRAGISKAGYLQPTEIQAQTIPAVLAGRDVLGLAQTGTGKTAAFALPILERLLDGPRKKLRALILSPTRELAEQTHAAFTLLGQKTGLRSLTLYGGVAIQPQISKLRAGAEIAVACPGRLLDLMGQREVRLDGIEIFVLDEADRMFDMGFLPDIRRIAAALPRRRQTLLYSATMPAEIRSLAGDFLRDPVSTEIKASRPIETVSHGMYAVEQTRKTDLLMALLDQTGSGQVLIFTRTKHRANKLAGQLVRAGFLATSLQGNLSQSRRQEAMNGFRKGLYQIMVATDIASRGIDVSQITHVINYDLPDTAEAYTHRIGRTGRMTRLGTALSLVTEDDVDMLQTIERLLGSRLERRFMEGFELAPGRQPQSALAYKPDRFRNRAHASRPQRRLEPTPSSR